MDLYHWLNLVYNFYLLVIFLQVEKSDAEKYYPQLWPNPFRNVLESYFSFIYQNDYL